MNKKIALTIIILGIQVQLMAQASVSGTVKDSNNAVIPYAGLTLKRVPDSTIIQNILANKEGFFSFNNISKGNYSLLISSIGYDDLVMEVFADTMAFQIDILLKKNKTEELSAVTVVAKKPQAEQKIDRLVFNVAVTPIGRSGSALEVLERLPGIEVNTEGGSIYLNSKQNVGILIDNKVSRISISNLMQMLSGTNANNIEKIEVISNPPAKYEAEFAGGLINIVYKKKKADGLSGSYLLGLGYGKDDKEKAGFNWNFKKKTIVFFGDVNYDRNDNPRIFTFDNHTHQDTVIISNTVSKRHPVITTYTARLGFDYYINPKWTTGFLGNFSSNHFKETVNSTHFFSGSPPDSAKTVQLWNWQNSFRNLTTINFNNYYQFDTTQSLSLDIDYLNFHSEAPNDYRNTYYNERGAIDSTEVFRAFKITPVHIWAGSIHYSKTFNRKVRLEMGGKYTYSKLRNDVNVANFIEDAYVINLRYSDHSKMSEQIIAAYNSFHWDMNPSTKVNAGLRYENYRRTLLLKDNSFENMNVNQLFPTFFISKAVAGNQQLQFSYGRRINRPSFSDLAPYIMFLDPHTFSYGNIKLEPAIANVFSISYKYKTYIATLEHTNEEKSIVSSQAIFADNGDRILTSLNIPSVKTTSLLFIVPVRFTKWWSSENSIQGIYVNQQMEGATKKDQWISLKTTQDFKLNRSLSFQFFMSYTSKRLLGVSIVDPMQRVNVSIDKKIDKIQSSLQLSVNNIFGMDYRFTTNNQTNNSSVKYAYESRIFRLTFTKNFGTGSNSVRKRETASDEQRKRLD